MPLTEEQARIVEAGDIDVAVSAGAGSGKTHVLVERYVHLLGRVGIPEIVAVTFTEAAAVEMRQRIRREVMQRPELAHHRRHVDDAVVGTIHSLCLRLLREFPVEAGLDPGAELLAEDEAELLRQVAATEAIDAAAESGDARTEALRVLGVWATTQQLPQMVAQRDEVRDAFAAMPGEDAAAWAEAVRARLDDALQQAVEPMRQRVVDTFIDLWSVCLDRGDLLAAKAATAEGLLGDPRSGDFRDWHARLSAGARAINLQGGRASAWSVPVADVRDLLRGLRDEVLARLAGVPAWNEWDDVAMAALPGLRALFEDACDRYARAKAERRALDFLDLEVEAVRLLEEHPAVADACRTRFRHVMVDEAQDVSPIQERLIRRLIGEGEGRPRLFLVGDAKQSIYAFRGADVRRFNALRDLVRQWRGDLLPLSASFRTHAALVELNNALFDLVFADGAGGVAMDRMSGRETEPPAAPHLTLLPVTRSEDDRTDATRRRVEADLVAEEVARVLDEGRLIWDKRLRAYRVATPRDVAVLLRRFSNVHLFEQALESRGVPYTTPSGTGFFSRDEVVDLGNLLRWLAEPDDEIALLAVLRSPMFVLADDTLLALRGPSPRPFILALAEPPTGIEEDEAERCRFAAEVLRDLQRGARTDSAAALLEQALVRTGYEASWAPVGGGEQVLANIRKLLRIVRGLGAYPLNQVVEYLAQRRDDQLGREGPAILDRRDAVQLMTVHGAKGLEFPVVFVPEAHLPASAGNETIRWRRDGGVSFTLDERDEEGRRQQPGFHAWLRARDAEDEAQEHLRLFYVAATRAGDYLTISGDESTSGAGWLGAADAAYAAGVLASIERREAVPADRSRIADRPPPEPVRVPPVTAEVEYVPPLLERPLVIPLRTSTPATGFRIAEGVRWGGHGDGLGRLRGTVAHRAIELAYTTAAPVDVAALVRAEAQDALAPDAQATLVAEVEEMVARFRASAIGRAIARPEAEARFESPFAWDWDGVPVHGTVDLLFREGDGWRVVDFKTDRVTAGRSAEAAAPYLVQIGIYARALAAATGAPVRAGLLFLRTGEWYEASPADLDAALAEARARIDAGTIIDDGGDTAPVDDDR
ncbi:MAG: ATP-dependent DNA helicase [Chloroflexota bacterium]